MVFRVPPGRLGSGCSHLCTKGCPAARTQRFCKPALAAGFSLTRTNGKLAWLKYAPGELMGQRSQDASE